MFDSTFWKGGYTTVAGLEPARALPNGFQVHLNSHYEKLSFTGSK